MNLTDKANQLEKKLGPGIWQDKNGSVHFSIPEILKHYDLEPTMENIEETKKMLVELGKRFHPNTPIIYRKSPTDDGEDLR